MIIKKIIFFLTIFSLSCISAQTLDVTQLQLVEAKVGLKKYPIDKTTLSEITVAFGNNYEQKKNCFYTTKGVPVLCEIKYKNLGVSFYFFNTDKTKTIKAVRFYEPFKVKTKLNISIGKSTIADVLSIYNNKQPVISGSGKVTINQFDLEHTGIYFSAQIPNFSVDKFPSKKQIEQLVINEIYISNYQHEFLVN